MVMVEGTRNKKTPVSREGMKEGEEEEACEKNWAREEEEKEEAAIG